MSHTPQQPADGWQPSQQQPPVYRPNEQPPAEEPPPWSPESQRMSSPQSQQVEDDGTVKYVGGPGMHQSPQYGPPPGVPVSPFDAPPQQGMPAAPFDAPMHPQQGMPMQGMQASDPFAGGGGMPVSGMPVSGMPPVSSIPASGMPVSSPGGGQYGQPPVGGGQFGPQGGQLVPVSGGGAQPWGAPDAIQRKKKGGKGPMWLLLVGIVVIAAALGVGGFILFNPGGDGADDEATGTISNNASEEATQSSENSPSGEASESAEAEAPAADTVLANEGSGLSILVPEGSTEATTPPEVFSTPTGSILGGTGPTVYFGALAGGDPEAELATLGETLQTKAAEWAGGAAENAEASQYRVDTREGEFRTFTVGDVTVMTAIIKNGSSLVGFVGTATADQVEALDAARSSISFGP